MNFQTLLKKELEDSFNSDVKREYPQKTENDTDFIDEASIFLKSAEDILQQCDQAISVIDKASALNKETVGKIKTQTQQIIHHLENKLQMIMNGQSKSSKYGQREILTFIERNKDNMDQLRASIKSLEQEVKVINVKLSIKKQTPTQIPLKCKKEGIGAACNFQVIQSVVDQTQRIDAEYCGSHGNYFALCDNHKNLTCVYDQRTLNVVISEQGNHKLLTSSDEYIVLGQNLYQINNFGAFVNIKRLDDGIVSALFIDSAYLIVGLPEYLRLATYSLSGIDDSTKPLLKPFVMLSNGSNKAMNVSYIERSFINSNTILLSFKAKLMKASLEEITGTKSIATKLSHSAALTLDQIWFGKKGFISCFKQTEEQYIVVLTQDQCLVIDQISTNVIYLVEHNNSLSNVLLCPHFNLAEYPWLVTLDNDGRVQMQNVTQKAGLNGQGSGLKALLNEYEDMSGDHVYFALNHQGQIEQLRILL